MGNFLVLCRGQSCGFVPAVFMKHEVTQDAFSGPLGLLLELIEQKDLDITKVSLANVTEDYVRRIEEQEVPTEELADFLVIAAKLIYIKSRAILPDDEIEVEADVDSLAAQLRLYREFVEAADHIEILFGNTDVGLSRPRVKQEVQSKFSPAENATVGSLAHAFGRLQKRLEPFFALRQESIKRVVSVQQRIYDIQQAIKSRATMTFRDITSHATSKVDVVVSFLALLELMKQQVINVTQSSAFGDIELKRVD